MFQAIVTKYHGPTNTRGSRITAKADGGRVTVPYDHALNAYDNHRAACAALLQKMGWEGAYHGGSLPDGNGDAFACETPKPVISK